MCLRFGEISGPTRSLEIYYSNPTATQEFSPDPLFVSKKGNVQRCLTWELNFRNILHISLSKICCPILLCILLGDKLLN